MFNRGFSKNGKDQETQSNPKIENKKSENSKLDKIKSEKPEKKSKWC